MSRSTTAALLSRLGLVGNPTGWRADERLSPRAAWARCPRADWLVLVATRLAVDRRIVVRAAARAVELALPLAHQAPIARPAWEVVTRWTSANATAAECMAARAVAAHAAGNYLDAQPNVGAVLDALSALAEACDAATGFEMWAAAGRAAEAVRLATVALDPQLASAAADRVREEIPWTTVAPLVARVVRTPIRSGVRDVDSAADEDTPVVRRDRAGR